MVFKTLAKNIEILQEEEANMYLCSYSRVKF